MKKILLVLALVGLNHAYSQDSLNMTKLGHLPYTDGLSDVWGYAANGLEYALVGTHTGFSVVDVTNPAVPVEKHFFPGATSIWRDIKTWSHYAYVVHDVYSAGSSSGLLIVDLNTINNPSPSSWNWYGPIPLPNNTSTTLNRAHNIYIDENGYAYLFGAGDPGGVNNGSIQGAIILDLNVSPTNPTVVGLYGTNYLHDGMVRGDTLWGSAVYGGVFEAIDVSVKSNPVVMASHPTPSAFTHNAWISDDNLTLYTTDEVSGAFIAAYDVSDFSNITELDRIQSSQGGSTIVHNTHVYGDFLVTSYYRDGIQIVDASQPDILVEVGYYDTSPTYTGSGFNGCWGAYPYLPSGRQLATDIEEGLYILGSDFPHASYIRGQVTDSLTGAPLPFCAVTSPGNGLLEVTAGNGTFKWGNRQALTMDVLVSKTGYITDTVSVVMVPGTAINLQVALIPVGTNFGTDENGFAAAGIQVFPVPSSGKLQLEFQENSSIEVLELRNLNGQLISSWEVANSPTMQVEFEVPAGLYLLQANASNGKTYTQKLPVH